MGNATVVPPTLDPEIVQGSGTGALVGISGKGQIVVEGKAKTLVLEYDLQ